jgi:large subunit ribosomal protein L11
MAKQITGYLKLQVKGGQANPAPPIGPALGSKGLNIMDFCKQFNARTQDKQGQVLPVLISIYNDKSFDFVIKTPPAAVLILDAAKKQKGSAEPNRVKVGSIRVAGAWQSIRSFHQPLSGKRTFFGTAGLHCPGELRHDSVGLRLAGCQAEI